MSEEFTVNPCSFKTVCINCNKVRKEDRPSVCESLNCSDYNPCPDCGMNKTLHQSTSGRMICKHCLKTNPSEIRQELKKKLASKVGSEAEVSTGNLTLRKIKITPPGTPPQGLDSSEVEYYNRRWEEYSGYYRNPAAYFICHMIIIEEINLTYLNAQRIISRGELNAEISRAYSASILHMKQLNDQLPEKEAEDVMDSEKSISVIYKRYMEIAGRKKINGVVRVFSSEAIALAPNLTFPVDPVELLKRCGYSITNPSELIAAIKLDHKKASEKTPKEILEFFGFKLDEQYAMKFEKAKEVENIEYEEEEYDASPEI